MSEVKQLDAILLNRDLFRAKALDVSSTRLAEMTEAGLSASAMLAVTLEHTLLIAELEKALFGERS